MKNLFKLAVVCRACVSIGLCGLLVAALCQRAAGGDAPPATGPGDVPLPTPAQADWLDAGIGIFVHWAPNVYQAGEGDNLSTPRQKINPDRFDAAKIVAAAKSANAGYLIFVSKHVGGYCAWQTATTDYSLRTSPWKDGKGDMVGELAQACKEQGLGFGVYLSPRSDIHHVGTGGRARNATEQDAYNEIYRKQMTEILTQYGPMVELWFDGGNRVPVNDLIDQFAPHIITFQGCRTSSTRWVGNEYGFAPYPCWNTIAWKPGTLPEKGAGSPDGNIWCPAECDVSILRPAWFWKQGSDSHILSLDALLSIYYLSVGRGVNLLLNVTPDDHGELPAAQVRRLKEFGDEVKARFAKPIATTHGAAETLTLELGKAQLVDHLLLREEIRRGERVRRFIVEGRSPDGTWSSLMYGSQIGVRQIVPIKEQMLDAVRLKVEKSVGQPIIAELSVFQVGKPVPKTAYRTATKQPIPLPHFSRSRDGLFAIDCPSPNLSPRYTLDGTDPTRGSTVWREPQALPNGGIVKARYFDTDDEKSPGGPIAMRHFGLPQDQIKVIRASSAEPDLPATAAFDADPKTYWHTAWRKGKAPPPHHVIVDLGQARSVRGVAYLPRQNAPGTLPVGVRLFLSESPDAFPDKPQLEGSFGDFKDDPKGWHYVVSETPARGRYLKIVYPEELRHTSCVATAELEILVTD